MSDFETSIDFLEREHLLHQLSPQEAIKIASYTQKNVIFSHDRKLYVCPSDPESNIIEINPKDLITILRNPQKDISDFLANLDIIGEISTTEATNDSTDLYLGVFLEATKMLVDNKNPDGMKKQLIKKRLDNALKTVNLVVASAENQHNFQHASPLLSDKVREELSNSLVLSMIKNAYEEINGELLDHDIENAKATMFFDKTIISRCKNLDSDMSSLIRTCYEREKYSFDKTLGLNNDQIKHLETLQSHLSLLKPQPSILHAPTCLSRNDRESTDYQSCRDFLDQLSETNKASPHDSKMLEFITEKRRELSANMTNLRQVKALKFSLKTLVESPVTRIILDRVKELNNSWFSGLNGKSRKAKAILNTFYNIPPSDRPFLFTGRTKEINECQEAMSVSRGLFENKPKSIQNNASLRKVKERFYATIEATKNPPDVNPNFMPWNQPEPKPISSGTKKLHLNINLLQNSLGDFMTFLAGITPNSDEKAALDSCCDIMNEIGNRDIKTDYQYQTALGDYAAVRDFFSKNIRSVGIVADADILSNLLSPSNLPPINVKEDDFREDSEKSFSNQSRNSRSEDDSDNESSISY
jgi:hypothetical protein